MEKIYEGLLKKIYNAIKETVSDKKIGIAFSGGVDSSLLAKTCFDLNYDITLLTIGFKNSHDILFSKKVNELFGFSHEILEIDPNSFNEISAKIKNKIQTENLSWNENCIAFYYVSQLAKKNGINTVVTANGIDELFCGYNAYREAIQHGKKAVEKLMEEKLENELKMMEAVNKVASEFEVKVVQPMLSDDFIRFAKIIPISKKIQGKDDLLRKHIIRELGSKIGVPEIAYGQRKKALQYGSMIHKALVKAK